MIDSDDSVVRNICVDTIRIEQNAACRRRKIWRVQNLGQIVDEDVTIQIGDARNLFVLRFAKMNGSVTK